MENLSKEQIEKLIELVRKQPSLYNKNCLANKHKGRKNKLWIQISRKLNLSKVDVQKAWWSLLEQYVRCKNEQRWEPENKNTFAYYEALQFLNETIEPKGTYRTSDISSQNAKIFLIDSSRSSSESPLPPLLTSPKLPLSLIHSDTSSSPSPLVSPSLLELPSALTAPLSIASSTSPSPSPPIFLSIPAASSSASSSPSPTPVLSRGLFAVSPPQKKKRPNEDINDKATTFLSNLVETSTDDNYEQFFGNLSALVRRSNLNSTQKFEFECKVMRFSRNLLEEMGKLQ